MLIDKKFNIIYRNVRPDNCDQFKIGIIGAGNIVENSHLPTYIKEKLKVTNIFDLSKEKARNLKNRFKIDKYSNSLDEFFDDNNFDIVDIAVPAEFNEELIKKTLSKNKNILVQKPLSNNINSAKRIIKEYNNYNLKVNVNHQMRYSPAIRAAKYILKKKYLGNIIKFNFYTHRKTDWSIWPWLEKIDYPELRYNSIHYLDSLRYLFGEPLSIKANLLSSKNGIKNKPTNLFVDLNFPNQISGSLNITHDNNLSKEKWTAGYEIIGEKGKCRGIISSMIGNGFDFNDKIAFNFLHDNKSINLEKTLNGRWFSESFAGPIFSLIDSIQNNYEPETNILDAYKTLNLVEKVIRSNIAKSWLEL